MQRILFFLWFLNPCTAVSQPGFNNTYDLGYYRNQLHNLTVHNDTLVGYGRAYSDLPPNKQCLFVTRFDSSGIPIDNALICDSLGGHLTMAINWSDIVITSDGGYALTGASFDRHNGIFVKLRNDLSLEFVQEYLDSVNLVEFYNSIVELPDGYLLGGYLQTPNYLAEAFLRRVDKQGNSLWFSYYGEYNVFDFFSNYCQLNDSIVAYTGGYIKDENSLSGRGPWIALINPEDGEVMQEWRPMSSSIQFLHYLHPLSNNKWLLYGKNALQTTPILGARPFWALADTDFNIEELKLFGPGMYTSNFFWDFEPTPDGNFIAAGQTNADNPNIEPDVYGWLYKVSPVSLDSLWSLKLTAPIPNVQQSGNYLGGVGVLSSGNMVAGGYSQSGNNIYCWLVKFTPDGCVDTLWCATTPAWEPVEVEMKEKRVKVWPNPASDHVFIEIPEHSKPYRLEIYTLDGRLCLHQILTPSQAVDVSELSSGLYMCRTADMVGRSFYSKLVIQR